MYAREQCRGRCEVPEPAEREKTPNFSSIQATSSPSATRVEHISAHEVIVPETLMDAGLVEASPILVRSQRRVRAAPKPARWSASTSTNRLHPSARTAADRRTRTRPTPRPRPPPQ